MIVITTAEGVYRYVSAASKRLFGWEPSELEGQPQDHLVHPDDLSVVQTIHRLALTNDSVHTTTFRFRHADRSDRWAEATFRRVIDDGDPCVVASIRDISERQKIEVGLRHQALTDQLTGLANRTVLMDRLRHALLREERSDGVLAVLFLDLDRFKVINDSLGHPVGDAVLREMAGRLAHLIRTSDTLARWGGDEFVIVAEDLVDAEDAAELGRRLTNAGRKPFQVGEEEFVCTLSVGVAVATNSQRSGESLLQEADLALYKAKDRGRDRVEMFDEDLRTKAMGRLGTERMLRRALDEQRIRVHYQPIVDLRTGRTVSAEALVRISDPGGGMIYPAAFLDVAEETGLLVQIDEMVFFDAVRCAAAWHSRFGDSDFSSVAVNVTARHLADVSFTEGVIAALDREGLPRSYLQVEVTERVLMEASNSALTGLTALRKAGIQVGLDDFGTGYSSLAYLRNFPLDFVKIDRSFIDGLASTKGGDAIVSAVVGLSHALGLVVVAEGVETQAQLDFLNALGCDRAQGYLFARPGEAAAVDKLIMAGRSDHGQARDVVEPTEGTARI
jgi:diguanylate cyclase (GGDEF)-like protein/PAS domain S-box-containing protein